jgi:hypothetical protein
MESGKSYGVAKAAWDACEYEYEYDYDDDDDDEVITT